MFCAARFSNSSNVAISVWHRGRRPMGAMSALGVASLSTPTRWYSIRACFCSPGGNHKKSRHDRQHCLQPSLVPCRRPSLDLNRGENPSRHRPPRRRRHCGFPGPYPPRSGTGSARKCYRSSGPERTSTSESNSLSLLTPRSRGIPKSSFNKYWPSSA